MQQALHNTMKYISRHTFGAVFGVLAMLLIVYSSSLIMSVVNVVEREDIKREQGLLSSEITQLESEYMAKTRAITMEYARSLGFSEVVTASYISPDSGTILSLNDDDR